jgi:diguanylate cyclase (GGDEF)-like protein
MRNFFQRFAAVPRGMRYKLLVAFALMSLIPLLVSVYMVNNYVFPRLENISDVSIVILLSITIAILGLFFAKKMIDPVIDMAIEARCIAEGDYDRKIEVSSDDEVGHLGESINIMTQKIKTNLEELKSYGQRTREINIEIHKKVLVLSSLLQISDIISAGSMELNALLELAVQKAAGIFDDGYSVLYMPRDDSGDFAVRTSSELHDEKLGELLIRTGDGLFGRAMANHAAVIVDETTRRSRDIEAFRAAHNAKNLTAIPLYSGKMNLGLFVIGNRADDFKFKDDDIDLVKVFAKQIAIAIENDLLIRKTEELEIKDYLTDLYNKNYVLSRLEEEIKRAIFYQRPCSFIVFNVDNFKAFRDTHGELTTEEALKKMAKLIRDNTAPIGKAARIGADEFAMLLPEKNKREAMRIAEETRHRIEATAFLKDAKVVLTVSAGVSENPIDGATSGELFKKAGEALQRAKGAGKNRVEA